MSKYNDYAKKLDIAFKAARDEFASEFEKLKRAKENAEDAQRWTPGKAVGTPNTANVMRAKAALLDAEAGFKDAEKRIWSEFNKERAAIRNDLEAAVIADRTASPDAVDTNGLELLKSGILTPDDFVSLAEKYDGNPTMLRLVSKYAKLAANDNPEGRAILNNVAIACQDGMSAALRAWDGISTIADYCSGQSRERRDTPEHTINMGRHWEELSADAIENF